MRPLPLLLVLLCLASCSSAYYSTMEAFGFQKRDILVDRIEEGRDSQQAAKKEFQSALDAFRSVTGFKGGDLAALHTKLSSRLSDCEARASDVHGRIEAIEDVAGDLFKEWKREIGEYDSADLRRRSEDLMRDTHTRYDALLAAMKKAERTMDPVLKAFRDQVLFLKHNLNAQAIAALSGNVASIEADVARLVSEMEVSISEADAFIDSLTPASG
jgi:hypothetical protein